MAVIGLRHRFAIGKESQYPYSEEKQSINGVNKEAPRFQECKQDGNNYTARAPYQKGRARFHDIFLLVVCYPSYEELLSCLTFLPLTDCRAKILEAREAGPQELSGEIKPVQRAISGMRKKLREAEASFQISSVPDAGL
ncbi:MAG TPA: hypothetical protein VKV40_14920 [Ktedonobacteraceae bacterium]|nr:hypothetical protein [Ktedonobacteraceae bacterium]